MHCSCCMVTLLITIFSVVVVSWLLITFSLIRLSTTQTSAQHMGGRSPAISSARYTFSEQQGTAVTLAYGNLPQLELRFTVKICVPRKRSAEGRSGPTEASYLLQAEELKMDLKSYKKADTPF